MGFQLVLIDGEWGGADSGDTIPVYGPSDGKEIARIARGTKVDIDRGGQRGAQAPSRANGAPPRRSTAAAC